MSDGGPGGHAILLAWTDIDPDEETAFNDWYNREHVRDRVLEVPGFLRGRRFVALKGAPRYLGAYETTGPEVLTSEAYIGLISNPDPNSAHFIPRFRNPIRTLGRLSASLGEAEGGFLALVPLTPREGEQDRVRGALRETIMPELLGQPSIVAAELLERDDAARAASTRRHVRQGDRSLHWALFVEAADLADLSRAIDTLVARIDLPIDPAFETSLFQMIYRVDSRTSRRATQSRSTSS